MGQIWVDIEQDFGADEEIDNEKLKNFKSKHKDIIDLFDGEFLKEYSSGVYDVLGEQSFQIDSRDLVGKNLARARFFSYTVSSEGDVGFGWGNTTGFPVEFYSDLYKLLGGVYFTASVTVSGDDGYYSGSYKLIENGIEESFTYYAPEETEEEYDDWYQCDTCSESYPYHKGHDWLIEQKEKEGREIDSDSEVFSCGFWWNKDE